MTLWVIFLGLIDSDLALTVIALMFTNRCFLTDRQTDRQTDRTPGSGKEKQVGGWTRILNSIR